MLEEVRLARPWTAEEATLADAVAGRLRSRIPVTTDCTLFDGLAGYAGSLLALGADGTDEALERLASIAVDGGWPQSALGPPRYLPETRIHDATLGTAGVLLAALWARRRGVSGADPVVDHAVAVLLAEAEHLPTGHRLAVGARAPCHRTRRPADAELVARPGRDRRRRSPWPARSWTDRTWSRPRRAGPSTW